MPRHGAHTVAPAATPIGGADGTVAGGGGYHRPRGKHLLPRGVDWHSRWRQLTRAGTRGAPARNEWTLARDHAATRGGGHHHSLGADWFSYGRDRYPHDRSGAEQRTARVSVRTASAAAGRRRSRRRQRRVPHGQRPAARRPVRHPPTLLSPPLTTPCRNHGDPAPPPPATAGTSTVTAPAQRDSGCLRGETARSVRSGTAVRHRDQPHGASAIAPRVHPAWQLEIWPESSSTTLRRPRTRTAMRTGGSPLSRRQIKG